MSGGGRENKAVISTRVGRIIPSRIGTLPLGLPQEQLLPTIGIITPLEKEYAAVRCMLDKTNDYEIPGTGDGRRYCLGEIPATNNEKHIVVLALASPGNNSAAYRAGQLLYHFPKVDPIFVVGIAGGVPNLQKPEEHVRLGDIVVSDHIGVIQYGFNKEEYDFTKELPIITPRPSPRPASANMVEAARLFRVAELRGNRTWLNYIHRTAGILDGARPSNDEDILIDSNNPQIVLEHPLDPNRIQGQPRVFLGPIASADKLLKNPKLRDILRDSYGVKAVEMEASGLADATYHRDVSYFVVRGICDYCDQKKNDRWQAYAAVIAAAYMRGLLESIRAISRLWK